MWSCKHFFFPPGVMSSWINVKRMETAVGSRDWETVPATLRSVQRSAWWLEARLCVTGHRTIPSQGNRPGMLLCRLDSKKSMKLHQQKNKISGSYHLKALFPSSEWMFPYNGTTVALFIFAWKWLLQLLVKGRVFIISSCRDGFQHLNTVH